MELMGSDGNYIPIEPGRIPECQTWKDAAQAMKLCFPNPPAGRDAPRTYSAETVSHHWYYDLKPLLLKKFETRLQELEASQSPDGKGEHTPRYAMADREADQNQMVMWIRMLVASRILKMSLRIRNNVDPRRAIYIQ
jgi:hypothetical protein